MNIGGKQGIVLGRTYVGRFGGTADRNCDRCKDDARGGILVACNVVNTEAETSLLLCDVCARWLVDALWAAVRA